MQTRHSAVDRSAARGFTLVEMLVVVAIIGILAAMLLPALARGKDQANRIKCVNNLKQLVTSAIMYADDNEDQLPPRRSSPNHWVSRLKEYYVSDRIVECPKGHFSEATPHSYLINGFGDYFKSTLTDSEYQNYDHWLWPYGMRMGAIPQPTDTILFGEKLASSYHVHMDLLQASADGTIGNDLQEVDHGRHTSNKSKAGVSNHAYVDGSTRTDRYGSTLNPVNMWALVEEYRQQPVDTSNWDN